MAKPEYLSPISCQFCGGEHMTWEAIGVCADKAREAERTKPLEPRPLKKK